MKTLSKILLAASCLLPASAAAAPTVKSFAIHNGNNAGLLWNNGPRNNDQRGTGLEHMSSHILAAAEGGPVVLTIGTGSYTDIPGSPVTDRLQGLCTSFKVDETAGLVKGTMRYFTNNRGNESPDHAKLHAVRRGETLQSIAAQEYDDPNQWRRIADANGIDDPFRLDPGARLIIPPILR